MGQVLTSTQQWFDKTNNAMGMVSFATLLMMFSNDLWQLDWTPRTWVRWMVYFDSLAFLISYIGTSLEDLMPYCWQRNAFKLAAGIVWSLKDALKYGYLAFKATKISGYQNLRFPYYLAACGSLVLYWIFLLTGYGFVEPNCAPMTKSQVPRLALYLYWSVVDLGTSVVVINKMRQVISASKEVKMDHTEFYTVKFREEIRLLIASIGMSIVTVLSIISIVEPKFNVLSIWRIVFVYLQLVMVMASQTVPTSQTTISNHAIVSDLSDPPGKSQKSSSYQSRTR
ncbi:hypothetical protein BDR26DRAFT_876061 [Obelidium mucronatum]|nr:hypothetical protein BDR26DRAFT_876061 [Obelidium mucronatum]